MAADYTLLMQKTTDGSAIKSSLTDFGFAVSEIPWPDEEAQDVAVREWPGEDGEDAYIPASGLKLKAYDLEVKFIYKGNVNTAMAKSAAFRDYLIGAAGDGAELKLFDPYWGKGRTKARLLKITDIKAVRTNIDEGLTFKATFRIADPKTEITLAYVGD